MIRSLRQITNNVEGFYAWVCPSSATRLDHPIKLGIDGIASSCMLVLDEVPPPSILITMWSHSRAPVQAAHQTFSSESSQ